MVAMVLTLLVLMGMLMITPEVMPTMIILLTTMYGGHMTFTTTTIARPRPVRGHCCESSSRHPCQSPAQKRRGYGPDRDRMAFKEQPIRTSHLRRHAAAVAVPLASIQTRRTTIAWFIGRAIEQSNTPQIAL
jgi:hypothetical protein